MYSPSKLATAFVLVASSMTLGCGNDAPEVEPLFPDDYETVYTEVRDCRPNGGSHDFNNIRVLAGPDALVAYRDRSEPFPIGSVVLKEEYDPGDTSCSGSVLSWTVMRKLPAGNDERLNWEWQRVDSTGFVESEDEGRCIGCHAGCGLPEGYDATCTVP